MGDLVTVTVEISSRSCDVREDELSHKWHFASEQHCPYKSCLREEKDEQRLAWCTERLNRDPELSLSACVPEGSFSEEAKCIDMIKLLGCGSSHSLLFVQLQWTPKHLLG